VVNVRLVELTARNWRACADLQVQASQEAFTRSALYSIAEAQFYPNTTTRGLATPEGELVGFALYGWDEDAGCWWIYRFLIDRRHQGKGYGRSGLKLVIDDLASRPDCSVIGLRYHHANVAAQKLYESFGFGQLHTDGDQVVATLDVTTGAPALSSRPRALPTT
jgi:diamine N-acetyltransferase